jgi:hypothetical protein
MDYNAYEFKNNKRFKRKVKTVKKILKNPQKLTINDHLRIGNNYSFINKDNNVISLHILKEQKTNIKKNVKENKEYNKCNKFTKYNKNIKDFYIK